MGLATGGEWAGSLTGATIDGVDMWEAITENLESPHGEMLHYADGVWGCSLQQGMMKIDVGDWKLNFNNVTFVFEEDLSPESSSFQCTAGSLMTPQMTADEKDTLAQAVLANDVGLELFLIGRAGATTEAARESAAGTGPSRYIASSPTQSTTAVTYSVLIIALVATVVITFAGIMYRVNKAVEATGSKVHPSGAVRGEYEPTETTSLLPKSKV
jgi:hypothetical protein